MHPVSPVHVYVENDLKTPMIGTNLNETLKYINKGKLKKDLKNLKNKNFVRNQPKKKENRPRSYSPFKSSDFEKSKNKNKEHLTIFDEIPERDNCNPNRLTKCETYFECKQRSRSPSLKFNSNDDLNEKFTQNWNKDKNFENSHSSFDEFLNNKKQIPSENINNKTYILENNEKYYFDDSDTNKLNFKKASKNISSVFTVNEKEIYSKLSNHELLIYKLIECESVGNDITKQLSVLKDYLKLYMNEDEINIITVKRLENERDMLLKNLETYENVNGELKDVLYSIKSLEKNDYRRNLANESLIKHIDGLEEENYHLKKLLLDLEKNVMKFGNENDHFKLENSALCNLKLSLENNRAHLQKQLNSKEAEISRLSVKLRIAERKTERIKHDLDSLKKNGLNHSNKLDKNNELSKELEKNDDLQTKKLIARLQNEIKQKDVLIKELINESKKFESESNFKLKDSSENTSEYKEPINCLREREKFNDQKLNDAYKEIERLKANLEAANSLIANNKEKNKKEETNEELELVEEKDNEAKRIKHFRELELDKVRTKLQQRLNELEPLPELLKNTELKLHESLKRQKEHETRNLDLEKLINELNTKIEKLETIVQEKENLLIRNKIHNEPNKTNISNEHIERKIKSFEDENHDLLRQLSKKDEALRDANNRLTIKSNEATSLSRQLELAINDSKLKEEHIKDKYSSKERSLQTRCIELETQLSKLKIDYNGIKRDREEIDYKFQSQIKDMKDKLDQSYATNKSMQNYVNFLKNSYSTLFNDNSIFNENNNFSLKLNNNELSQNFIKKAENSSFY